MNRDDYIPFGKPNFSEEEIEAVSRVMRSGWIGMGQETLHFEEELANYLDVPHVVTVNSCTSALFLSLLVEGVGPGDEVICPSLTWCSSANAALHLGARVVFCDVDRDTLSATPQEVASRVTGRTRAVVLVHMGGYAVDVAALRAALPDHVAIVEDCAHALGSRHEDGRRVGSSGNTCCFSFYANKNLSTGEGGAVALDDANKAVRLRSLRQHALQADAWKRFVDPRSVIGAGVNELGYKMNFTDLQAAIGRVQLRRQEGFGKHREAIARRYLAKLATAELGMRFQRGVDSPTHALHLLVAKLPLERLGKDRNRILMELREKNVGVSIHYLPLHLMPFYRSLLGQSRLPDTEYLSERIMTLPISASMSLEDVDYVAQAVENSICDALI